MTSEGIQRVGVVREGRVVQEFQSHDDLASALAMLKRASTSSRSRPSGEACSGGPLPESACLVLEGYAQSAVSATAVNPQQADALIQKMRSAYMDLFEVTNDYEEELMQQVRSELQHDDEVDEILRELDAKKPSATATTKLGKRYASKTAVKHQALAESATTVFEPPSKFIALAKSMVSDLQFLIC